MTGAQGRTRTGKALRPGDFKSPVFTSFTTRASTHYPAERSFRSQPHMHVLLLREAQELVQAFLPPEAGVADAAERRAEKMLADFVDPDVAGVDAHRRPVRRADV